MTGQELGAMAEAHTAYLLAGAGFTVEQGGPADLVVEGIPVEVKAARRRPYRKGGYQGYQFSVWRPGHTDHRRAAVVVLWCYWHPTRPPVAFVIPAQAIGDRRQLVIPGDPWTYSGQWSRYYQRWEGIADVLGL